MKENFSSRFNNSIRNTTFAMMSQILTIVLNFVGRRIFVDILGAEYLGISTSFSGILSIISFAELGIGSAIIYSLYKPIAEKDTEKIKTLMRLFKKTYIIIGAVVLLVGSSITPFLSFFVKELPDIAGIKLIYLLLVLQSASEYFFSYKISFLNAIQRGYLVQKIEMAISVVRLILQIGSLLFFHSYIAYLGVTIICIFTKNVYASRLVDKKFPFLKEKAKKLEKKDARTISKNVAALFIYKVSQTMSSTIDTILIAKLLGVIEVAIYSNYHLIVNYCNTLFMTVMGAVTPSVGNLMATGDIQKKRDFFATLQMIYYWMGIFLAVGLWVMFNPLIELWLGKEYLFPQSIVVALVISTTLTNFQRPCSIIRDTCGLFWYGKTRPLLMSIINVVVSIFLIKRVGTIGVVIGTCIAKATTFVWYDPYIVFKHVFKQDLKQYFKNYIFQWMLMLLLAYICTQLYSFFHFSGISGFIGGCLLVTVVVNGALLLINWRTKEVAYIRSLIKNQVLVKLKNR